MGKGCGAGGSIEQLGCFIRISRPKHCRLESSVTHQDNSLTSHIRPAGIHGVGAEVVADCEKFLLSPSLSKSLRVASKADVNGGALIS